MPIPLLTTIALAHTLIPSEHEKSSNKNLGHAFIYDRASPSVRWPHLQQQQQQKLAELSITPSTQENAVGGEDPYMRLARLTTPATKFGHDDEDDDEEENENENTENPHSQIAGRDIEQTLPKRSDYGQLLGRKKRGKMSRLALSKATDWRERVQRLSEAVCELQPNESVADLLNKWPEQLAPTDYCFVAKQVGYTQWPRSLELFEWLNMKHWYTPNNRMLSTILGVLGRANQVNLAEEIFQRAEPELGDCVQVFNAILSVHARHGNWERMQTLLKIMLDKGCERDLVTYNTLISGRAKAGLEPGMAMEFLREIWQAGLRPDTVTYNTLISVSSFNKCYEDAVLIYEEMKQQRCQEDIWTYNSMISVYGRCGLDAAADDVYRTMQVKGFSPDAITYNSILFAYAKKGRMEDVDVIRTQMKAAGCREDEITYNTLIDMYGKKNLLEKALSIYEQMKEGRCRPDNITFVVLIDGLGKAGLVQEAELVFKEMMDCKVKPSLNTFCAMICAYAKAGLYKQAANMYQDMLKLGIRPDGLAYSVMLDVFLNLSEARKVLSIYESMMPKQRPGIVQCELMLRLFKAENMNIELEKLIQHMHQFGFDPSDLCSTFAKVGLCDAADKAFKTAVSQGQNVDTITLDLLLNNYARAGRLDDAQSLVNSVSDQDWERMQEQLIVILASAEKFEEAKAELEKWKVSGKTLSVRVFRALILAYEQAGMSKEVMQMLQEMQGVGLSPDAACCRSGVLACCRLGKPDDGHLLLKRIISELGGVKDCTLHLAVIKANIKLQEWEKSVITFEELKGTGAPIFLRDYNSLLLAYAQFGQSQQVQDLLKQMVEDGLTPSSISGNALLQALLSTGRLVEVDEAYQRFEELGVKPDMQTHVIMLKAYAKTGNVEKAKGLYQRLRNEGYILHIEVYNVMIGMFSKAGWVGDAEGTMMDMKEAGFEPDIYCYNSMISVYSKIKSFKKAARVFQGMQTVGCVPDTITYNTLIHLYSRCLHTQEAYMLLQQMKQVGCVPNLASYTMLLTAYGQMQMWEAAEALFKDMQESGIQADAPTYHLMIDTYRRAGRPELSRDLVIQMKEQGFEPTISTMHMLMDSYGKGGQTEGAEEVFEEMIEAGVDVNVPQYTSLIDGYLKEGDYKTAISRLKKMESDGVVANYVTWTCFIEAASKCVRRQDALMLLMALFDIGFTLPFRLLTERGSAVLGEMENLLETLQGYGPGAGSGLLNVLQDLLWAFHKRATAAHVFNMAIEKNIYDREFTRVREEDWGADLCKLSPGAALVALTLWLIRMQEAALQGRPGSSKTVPLVTGNSKRGNHISISKTVKSYLWEMGAPFLVSKTRDGSLMAKGYSVKMWLKDSPKCMDLELEDRANIPELNSMEFYEGAWVRRDMVPIFKQIEQTMGTSVRPKKFMRLANMHDEKRADVIETDIKGRAEKLAKDKIRKQKAKLKLPVRQSLEDYE